MTVHVSDSVLWERFTQGCDQSFSTIYHRFQPLLFRYGMKIYADEEMVTDCLHDFFMYLYTHREGFSPVHSLKAYLIQSYRRILLRKLTTHRNRMKREAAYQEELEVVDFSLDNLLDSDKVSSAERKRLLETVNRLSPRQKEIIYLKFFDNLTYGEIAEVTGLNYQTIVNQTNKALKRLRSFYRVLEPLVACISLLSCFSLLI